MNHMVAHFLSCQAEHFLIRKALGYGKKPALQFCERISREVTEAIIIKLVLPPVEKFVGIVFAVSVSTLAISALIVFASAIPRRS